MVMQLEEATILSHEEIGGGYRLLATTAPAISPAVQPGQFVHLLVPGDTSSSFTLRRPFSVYKAGDGELSILYKEVGGGTHAMGSMEPGQTVSLLGPLGRPYPAPQAGRTPVLVAGGYGMAALYLVALRAEAKGIAFFGGKSSEDILCVDEFEALGWDVRVATEDGTRGEKGLVTEVLEAWLNDERGEAEPEMFACGPTGMLEAVGRRAEKGGWTAWISMDRHMGCGVGACLTCVQKVRAPSSAEAPEGEPDGQWAWARVCKEGPVFECREIVWEREEEEERTTINVQRSTHR
jgi:dihydroorotate dehydrogenase electron transfer subunit